MTSFDAVTSPGMNDPPTARELEGQPDIPVFTPTLASPPCPARPAETPSCVFGRPGRSCAQAARERQPALHSCESLLPQHPALGFPFCFTGRDQFSSQLITSISVLCQAPSRLF